MAASAKQFGDSDAAPAGADPATVDGGTTESAIVAAVGTGQRVLELRVGQHDSRLGALLRSEHGCTVETRDLDPDPATTMASPTTPDKPGADAVPGEFAVVIAHDVLTRVGYAQAALRAVQQDLAPMGRLVCTSGVGHADAGQTLDQLVETLRAADLEPLMVRPVQLADGEAFVVVAQRAAEIDDPDGHAAAFDAEQRELRARQAMAARPAAAGGESTGPERRAVSPEDASEEIAALRRELAAAAESEAEARSTVGHLNHYMHTICVDNGFDPALPLADSMADWAIRQRLDDQHTIDRQEGELIRLRTLVPGPSLAKRLSRRLLRGTDGQYSDR